MLDVNWLWLNASHNQNLKYANCLKLDNELLSQQQQQQQQQQIYFGNSHSTDVGISVSVT